MNEKLTRREIARRLHDEIGSLSDARKFTDAFFGCLTDMIVANDKTKIHNFGVFRCVHKKERAGRNPKTGEAATITARRVVNFTAGRAFKERIANYDGDS